MTPPRSRPTGFSLTELLIVFFIILVLATASVALYKRVQERSTVTTCLGNLRTISQAGQLYLNQFLSLPGDISSILDGFRGFGLEAGRLRCPADRRPQATDSYSQCYVRRRRSDPGRALIACCGRHSGRERAALLFLDGAAKVEPIAPLRYTNSSGSTRELKSGDALLEGTLSAPEATIRVSQLSLDGSRPPPEVKPNSPLLIGSFRASAVQEILIFLPPTVLAQFEVQAGPKTRVELVSAQVSLDVVNGTATLVTSMSGGRLATDIMAEGGGVRTRRRDMNRETELPPGTSLSLSVDGP